MKTTSKILSCVVFACLVVLQSNTLHAQSSASKTKRILVDINHGQKFYNDPSQMQGKDSAFVERIKYMTNELKKNAQALKAEVTYQSSSITSDALAKCDLLFIHMPSSKFTGEEVTAIQKYLNKGGSLFLVMEVDYWATLEQANVNEVLNPYGIVFKGGSPIEKSGGYTKPGPVTNKRFSIPYHGARIVEGGTPFCFSNDSDEYPFGVYKEVKNGGKIIAMGDGMVSLYMTSWQDVNNYQCSEFMNDVLVTLLK